MVNPLKVVDLDARRADLRGTGRGRLARAAVVRRPRRPGLRADREAVDAGVDVVFACGGDGTVMACASELAGTDVALAVLPPGTGNLLAANLACPTDVAAGVAVAIERRPAAHRRRAVERSASP